MNQTRIAAGLIVLLTLFMGSVKPSMAVGPNMMPNSGFEGGSLQYTLQSPFTVVNDPANAHNGSWEMQAKLNQSYHSASTPCQCWQDTSYTTSIWYKGAGSVTLEVRDKSWTTVLASKVLTADADTYTKGTITWNSKKYNDVLIILTDNIGSGTMYFDDLYTGVTDMQQISFNADQPALSMPKFQLIFSDEFNSTKSIDLQKTDAPGYKWYMKSFFDPKYDNDPTMFHIDNGVITFTGCGNDWGEVLDSAHPAKNSEGFAGTVFSGGHGLYTEARIAFPTQQSIAGWWSTSLKGDTKIHNVMYGNPGHKEAIENDFMEYDQKDWGWPPNEWGSTIHDWGDTGSDNLANFNTMVTTPVGTDFTKYHTYGMLWVPATADNGWHGYHQAYFDGHPEQAICWVGNQTYKGVFPPTIESMGSYLFSEMDREQFMLILGGPKGSTPYMKVDYVRVYAVDKSSMQVVSP